MTTESEIDEIMELNKEIQNKKAKEKNKNKKEEIKAIEVNKDKDNEKIKINIGRPKINERKSIFERLSIIKKENNKNNLRLKSKSIIALMMPKFNFNKNINNKEKESKSFDNTKKDQNERRYKIIEKLFNLAKKDEYNILQSNNKKDI